MLKSHSIKDAMSAIYIDEGTTMHTVGSQRQTSNLHHHLNREMDLLTPLLIKVRSMDGCY